MSNKGFIVIDRCVEDWQWWGISSAMTLWFYILVKANWKEGFFLGQNVPRGAFCTSIRTISEETDLSESTIKRWLKKFESAGQITVKGTNKYSVISVINYAKYQDRENNVNQQMTEQVNHQVNQQVNHQVTEQVNHNRTNKQINKETNKQNTYIAKAVLDYLNELTGKHYKPVESSLKEIKARLNEGFSENDCKTVIEKKCVEWVNDPHMAQYLRPSTLFAAGHFQDYLNQADVTPARKGTTNRLLELADRFYGDERKEIEWKGNN